MESMMMLPDDIFRQELMHYLTVYDIVRLDTAYMNHKYRPQLLDKISGVILTGDKDKDIKASFKWLGMRRIYFINMNLDFNILTPSIIENNYVDQFRYTHHIIMSGLITDDIAMFIISHSPFLQSIDISHDYRYVSCQFTDDTLQSIAEHCTGLQSLSISNCRLITDTGLITISTHCPNLVSLKVNDCYLITDASILSISTHCTGLQSLHLDGCDQITDASIISISTHCTGLQSLHVENCEQITDASIISISFHCTGLQSLDLRGCYKISDISIIPIAEKCTGLKRLDFSYTDITDASLIAIAKNCTGLKYLCSSGCDGLSSHKLRSYDEFKSVSELRAVLLSIYPSLPI